MDIKNIRDAVEFILEGTISEDEYDTYRDLHKTHGFSRGRAMRAADAKWGNNQSKQKRRPGPGMTRQYLNVPYAERELAKKAGARWDPERKKWFKEMPMGRKWDPAEYRHWVE